MQMQMQSSTPNNLKINTAISTDQTETKNTTTDHDLLLIQDVLDWEQYYKELLLMISSSTTVFQHKDDDDDDDQEREKKEEEEKRENEAAEEEEERENEAATEKHEKEDQSIMLLEEYSRHLLRKQNHLLRHANQDLKRRFLQLDATSNILTTNHHLINRNHNINGAVMRSISVRSNTCAYQKMITRSRNNYSNRTTTTTTTTTNYDHLFAKSVRNNLTCRTNPTNVMHRMYLKKIDNPCSLLEVEAYRQGTYKTELCNKWRDHDHQDQIQINTCPYGSRCQFAHGLSELRPVLRHPRYKTELCRMLLNGLPCPYGHRCHFRHSYSSSFHSSSSSS